MSADKTYIIEPDGRIRGLWNDQLDLTSLGTSCVTRAGLVEFERRRQTWTVREGRPAAWWRRWLQWATGRSWGRMLFESRIRSEALAWEERYYGPGGPGWPF